MILLDFQPVLISNLMASIGKDRSVEVDEGLLRHMVLNTIRSYMQAYKRDWGELVVCCDTRHSWRKNAFPYYKANRKKARDESIIDWPAVFAGFDVIKSELKANFPYRVVEVEGAEADDIIGVLARTFGQSEKVLILSKDHDFIQLQGLVSVFGDHNVYQIDPIKKSYITHPDPVKYLKEHIIRGDGGDGVPNILNSDSCLVEGVRQMAMTAKRLELFMDKEFGSQSDTPTRNYYRNQELIDLTFTPPEIDAAIHVAYAAEANKTGRVYDYMVEKRLRNLLESVNEFA